MAESFALRTATPADIPMLHRLIRDFAADERAEHRFHLTEAGLHKALFAPHPLVFSVVADSGSTMVGFALWLYFFGTISGSYGMFVTNVFVAEPYRRCGIGLAMFRHMARIAVEKQCSVVQWDVHNWNTQAIEFYRHIGAEQLGADRFMNELTGDALTALARV
jgi:GNAT superfamily N-acetyltransferase